MIPGSNASIYDLGQVSIFEFPIVAYQLRARRALSLYNVYDDSALLAFNCRVTLSVYWGFKVSCSLSYKEVTKIVIIIQVLKQESEVQNRLVDSLDLIGVIKSSSTFTSFFC